MDFVGLGDYVKVRGFVEKRFSNGWFWGNIKDMTYFL